MGGASNYQYELKFECSLCGYIICIKCVREKKRVGGGARSVYEEESNLKKSFKKNLLCNNLL